MFYAVTGELLYTYRPPSPANAAPDDEGGPAPGPNGVEPTPDTGDIGGRESDPDDTEGRGSASDTDSEN